MKHKLKQLTQYTTELLFLISLTATTASLYLSLGMGLIPCDLCWYQRIFMYPLVIITGYSLYTKTQLNQLIAIFSSLGIVISGYHSYIQIAPSSHNVCSSACATQLLTIGPFSIPNLSFIAFALITGVLTIQHYAKN